MREHVADLASLRLTARDEGYDERRNGVRRAVLVQLLVVDRVGRLHRADSEPVHVEIVLRVDEAYVHSAHRSYLATRRSSDAPSRCGSGTRRTCSGAASPRNCATSRGPCRSLRCPAFAPAQSSPASSATTLKLPQH